MSAVENCSVEVVNRFVGVVMLLGIAVEVGKLSYGLVSARGSFPLRRRREPLNEKQEKRDRERDLNRKSKETFR
jgi:hypothetical protein